MEVVSFSNNTDGREIQKIIQYCIKKSRFFAMTIYRPGYNSLHIEEQSRVISEYMNTKGFAFLNGRYTKETDTTKGVMMYQLFFEIKGNVCKDFICELATFKPIEIGETKLEDPVFYRGKPFSDNVEGAIITHEGYGWFYRE